MKQEAAFPLCLYSFLLGVGVIRSMNIFGGEKTKKTFIRTTRTLLSRAQMQEDVSCIMYAGIQEPAELVLLATLLYVPLGCCKYIGQYRNR